MEIKDLAPWAGIAASLIWNFINSRNSARQRRQAHALSEFKSLKSAADAALSKLRAKKATIRALEASSSPTEEIKEEIQKINADVAGVYNDLVVALESLDQSSHSSKQDWASDAEQAWDEFVGAFDRLYAPKSPEDRKIIIASAVSKLDQVIDGVQKALERELAEKAD